MGEHELCKLGVRGSNPLASTNRDLARWPRRDWKRVRAKANDAVCQRRRFRRVMAGGFRRGRGLAGLSAAG